MPDYQKEREGLISRFHGRPFSHRRRPGKGLTIDEDDYLPIPTPVNAPYAHFLHGDCLIWKYGLQGGGHGMVTDGGRSNSAHRQVFVQSGRVLFNVQQVNHLCARPFCVQPSHLYAGSPQDNKDDEYFFRHSDNFAATQGVFLAFYSEELPDDERLRRLRASRRGEFVKPWTSQVEYRQEGLEDFRCPGHDFSIVAGAGKVCRICDRFEGDEKWSLNYHIAFIAKEFYPATQVIGSWLEKVNSLNLAGPEFQDWREACTYRGGIHLPGDDHDLKVCGCFRCIADRRTFRESLGQMLSNDDSSILNCCDLVPGIFNKFILQARQGATRKFLEGSQWYELIGDEGVARIVGHLADCKEVADVVKNARQSVEKAVATSLYAIAHYDDVDEFFANDRWFKYVLPVVAQRIPRLPRDEDTLWCIERSVDAAKGIWESLSGQDALFTESFSVERLDNEVTLFARKLLRELVIAEVYGILTYDLIGKTYTNEVRPWPHQRCIEEVIVVDQ